MNKAQIGLLSPFFQPITGYEESARDLGVDLVLVTARRIDWQNHEVQGLIYNGQEWEEKTAPLPRSFYNRYYGPKPKVVSRLETIIGKNKVFNHITRFDKWTIHQILANSDLKAYLPVSAPYSPESLSRFLQRFKQAIVKPAKGQLGTQVLLVREEQGNYYLHHGTKSPIARFRSTEDLVSRLESLMNRDFIIQEFIPLATAAGRVFDVRCLVQKGNNGLWEVTGMLSRLALSYSYITNVSHAICSAEEAVGQAFPGIDLLPRLVELSIQAAQAAETSLGSLGELSVDFGLDQLGAIWIIELNAKPMKSTFCEVGNSRLLSEIYRQPLRYALYLAST